MELEQATTGTGLTELMVVVVMAVMKMCLL